MNQIETCELRKHVTVVLGRAQLTQSLLQARYPDASIIGDNMTSIIEAGKRILGMVEAEEARGKKEGRECLD